MCPAALPAWKRILDTIGLETNRLLRRIRTVRRIARVVEGNVALSTMKEFRLNYGPRWNFSADLDACDVEDGQNGVVFVRVHSADRLGRPLPDAVFTFRPGDPQYEFWKQRLSEREVTR
jgi:hypothetical protein